MTPGRLSSTLVHRVAWRISWRPCAASEQVLKPGGPALATMGLAFERGTSQGVRRAVSGFAARLESCRDLARLLEPAPAHVTLPTVEKAPVIDRSIAVWPWQP